LLPFDSSTKYTAVSVKRVIGLQDSLVAALVFFRLHYGSATLGDLPKQLLDKLQSVQNAAAWLILTDRRQDHRHR